MSETKPGPDVKNGPDAKTSLGQPIAKILGVPGVKLGLIGGLLLLLQIPTLGVSSLVEERQARQDDVQTEIASSWGPPQSVVGPILVVPFRALEAQPRLANGQPQPPLAIRGHAHVLPSRLSADVALTPERRKRGLFSAIVYGSTVQLSGAFTVPQLKVPSLSGNEYTDVALLWQEAYVVAGSTDLRSASPDTSLVMGTQTLAPAEDPPPGADCGSLAFMRWNLGLDGPPAGQAMPFRTAFSLRGTGAFRLVPAARQVDMAMTASWPTPSFNGANLPARSTVTETGFDAEWRDTGGARQTVWFAREAMQCGSAAAAVTTPFQQLGVSLLDAVPTYRMVNRASKYAVLFMALAFLTYFLFESISGVAIGMLQYGLLGLSITMFALLLLAIAEPLGFALAYAAATGMVMLQASLYTLAVTRRIKLAGVFAGVLALLFGFLYVVLSLETYSLLAGAVALFAVLSVVMAITGRANWSARQA